MAVEYGKSTELELDLDIFHGKENVAITGRMRASTMISLFIDRKEEGA